MGRIQEGGVLTQKVSKAFGVAALLMMGVLICCPLVTNDVSADDTYVVDIVAGSDFCGVNTSLTSSDARTVTYTLNGNADYYYKAQLLNSDDVSSGSIKNNGSSGQLSGSSHVKDITVVAPLESGDYRLVVKFYATDDMSKDPIAEKTVPLKVVDPIVLTYTLKNEGSNAVTLSAYFVIDGTKAADSEQSVTIPAGGTKDVTYNYYVKDVEDTKYYLDTDDQVVKSAKISGLGPDNEKTFYAHDSDYGVVTTICIVILVILAIILFFILRKPVINKGKPKGRR